ncbi:MAG: type II toxin-antitoxin system antitoxin SocA domain-containing protein [Clostridiaceae bacterium]
MYKAIDIAKYIINKCIDFGRPVSNLQLQKILYYVQGEFMSQTDGEVLFKDDIKAWKYGPVVPSVYYEYNNYSSSDITTRQSDVELEDEERNIIDPIIEEMSRLSAWALVQKTHSESPWMDTYAPNRDEVITIEKMQETYN